MQKYVFYPTGVDEPRTVMKRENEFENKIPSMSRRKGVE